MKPLPIILTALLFSVGDAAAVYFKTGNEFRRLPSFAVCGEDKSG